MLLLVIIVDLLPLGYSVNVGIAIMIVPAIIYFTIRYIKEKG